MTEEEKQAIEFWEEKLKSYKKEIEQRQNDEFKGYGTAEDIAKLKYCNLHIILNLIEKQLNRIKDLEQKLNAKETLSHDMPEDTEFIIMTRDNYERNHGKM